MLQTENRRYVLNWCDMKATCCWALLTLGVFATSLLALIGNALGQEDAVPEGAPTAEQRSRHLANMKALAQSFRILAKSGQEESAAKLADEPLLRYADNTRYNNEASLWIWSSGGRPTAIAAIELYPRHPKGPQWLYEIASLSPERISAERKDTLDWTANQPGLKLTKLDGADSPADKPVRRLGQMKSLLRRFTAHETTATEGRIELRALTNPLHRYSDTASGVTDGAIFAFANGTNPEILLVLEASGAKGEPAVWQYALAQMTGGVVSVHLDEKEIWTRGEADPPAVRESYVNGWLKAEN
jgi:hypothetical protein